ncbi:MAG: hypothetical protein ABIR30_02065 [Chitinophagaceae bacterium]
MNQENTKLKENIIDQAKYYLENANEFYPFGGALKNNRIIPIGVYIDDERPESHKIFEILQRQILMGLKMGEYEIAAIGLDVFFKNTHPCLQIILYHFEKTDNFYYLYTKEENKYLFKEVKN